MFGENAGREEYRTVPVGQERILGIIGVLLSGLGVAMDLVVEGLGGIFSLLGIVLLLITFHSIGEKVGNSDMFTSYLLGLLVAFFGGLIGAFLMGLNEILGLIVLLPVLLGVAYFQKTAWVTLGREVKVENFGTAGNLIWYAAVVLEVAIILMIPIMFAGGLWALFIFLLVAGILGLLAWIMQLVGFINMPSVLKRRVWRRGKFSSDHQVF